MLRYTERAGKMRETGGKDMGDLIGGAMSNDSLFGKIMTKAGIIVAANILFMISTVPVVTAGAGFAALHYTILKSLCGDGEINPFKTFWQGLKDNWKQATAVWLTLLGIFALLGLEWYWCGQFGGVFLKFRYTLPVIAAGAAAAGLYIFPVMAAFRDSVLQHLCSSIYFAFHRPLKLIVIVFFSTVPLALTYMNPGMMPLYGFVWTTCGFSLVCLLTDTLLIKDFSQYIIVPSIDEEQL